MLGHCIKKIEVGTLGTEVMVVGMKERRHILSLFREDGIFLTVWRIQNNIKITQDR